METINVAQYAMSVVETAARMAGHTPRDWELLASVKNVTLPWGKDFGRLYGELLYSDVETSKLMSRFNRPDREQGFTVWYERLVSGTPGPSFWAETCLIGFMHASAGVDNGQVITAGTRLQEAFLNRCIEAMPGKRGIEVYTAFKRVFDVAFALMVDGYEQAIIVGMSQLGLNEKLLNRMRTVAIRKMIDQGRSSLPLIEWNDSLSVNVAEVDRQHKVLIGLLNQLHEGATQGKGNETLRKILNELTEYTKSHFAYEERVLKEHSYPEYDGHKESHDRLANQVLKFNEQFQSGSGALSADLFMFLRAWLNGHIRGSDRAYARFLNAKGVK